MAARRTWLRRAWALFRAIALYPIVWFYGYARDFEPGAGPQGGEAVALLGLLYFLLWLAIALVDGYRMRRAGHSRWTAWAVRVAPIAALWLVLSWNGAPLAAALLVALLLVGVQAATFLHSAYTR